MATRSTSTCRLLKARGLQVLELSLPARVLAINHILTATLWYFTFVWTPTEQDLRRLKTIITNFLWAKGVDEEKAAQKVSWSHLTQSKKEGGLGLVDPVLKTKVLHGQWILKAQSPTDYLWKAFMLDRLEQTIGVPGRPYSRRGWISGSY